MPAASACLTTERILVPNTCRRTARSSRSSIFVNVFMTWTQSASGASPSSTFTKGTMFLRSQRYCAAFTPSTSRSMVCSKRIAASTRSPSKAGLAMMRLRNSCMRSNICSSEEYSDSSMPYSASAFGVLPPLWSRAAKNPRPVATFDRCASFIGPTPLRRIGDHRSVRNVHRSGEGRRRPRPFPGRAGPAYATLAVMADRRRSDGRPAAPELIRPMLAVPGELPNPAEDAHWRYEMKWDGVRAVGYVRAGEVRLLSRNDLDVSRSYPEILDPPPALDGRQAVLDGELVTFDGDGRPSFGRLQERMHIADVAVARRLAERVPVVYLVFDLLFLDGRSLLRASYLERREMLEGLGIEGTGIEGTGWRVPPSFAGSGADVLAASRENRLEGVVAKRAASTYRPGARSPDWRKIKHVRMQEVGVAGWRTGHGRRDGGIGSLLLGVQGPAGLEFGGGVGTGFTGAMLADLARRLAPLERPDRAFATPLPRAELREAHWVEPQLVGEVVFTEWTGDGHLRHPSWRGLRPDKSPGEGRRGERLRGGARPAPRPGARRGG